MSFLQACRTVTLAVLFSFAAQANAETLQEYHKQCTDYIGSPVPAFNCQSGTLIPIDGNEGEGTCTNRALLNGKCYNYGRLGKIEAGPDVEIRFLCRHYEKASGPNAEGYDDIAVIQQNTKTGATCFYQSPTGAGTNMKAHVPSPADGDNTFRLSATSGCQSCHDNRGWIGTPFLKGVRDASAIPAAKKMNELFFPGEQTSSWRVSTVVAAQKPLCSNCHDMGTLTTDHLAHSTLNISNFMGNYNGDKSFEAHRDCVQNPSGPGCQIRERRHASAFPRPSTPTPTPTPGTCRGDQWFSGAHNRCFDKGTSCNQYSWTDASTCETPNDTLACDWNKDTQVCFAEAKKPECNGNQWYSSQYNRCFEKHQACEQYTATDKNTCETPNDTLACDWNESKKECYAETPKPTCTGDEWYSSEHNRCFAKNGACGQYSWTSKDTCETKNDSIACTFEDWSKMCVNNTSANNGQPKNGVVVQIVSRNSNKCLDVASNSKDNGAQMQQWECGGTANQKYRLEDMGKGEWRLHPTHTQKCVSVAEDSKNDGAKVHQWDCDGGRNQLVKFTTGASGSFRIQPAHSDKCLSVANESRDNGAKVHQWGCDGGSNQEWFLRE